MPQIGPFGDSVAALDTSDVSPVALSRYAPGALDRGRPLPGEWSALALPAPYVWLPAAPSIRAEANRGARPRERRGLISVVRCRSAETAPPLGKADRATAEGREWVCVDSRDWIAQAGYHAAVFELADEPPGQP